MGEMEAQGHLQGCLGGERPSQAPSSVAIFVDKDSQYHLPHTSSSSLFLSGWPHPSHSHISTT